MSYARAQRGNAERIALLTLLAALAACSRSPQDRVPCQVAEVVEIQGSCLIQRAADPQTVPVRTGEGICPGDTLEPATGSVIRIRYASGEFHEMSGGCKYTIGAPE